MTDASSVNVPPLPCSLTPATGEEAIPQSVSDHPLARFLAVGEFPHPSGALRMDFAVDFHVRLGKGVDGVPVLFRTEDEIAPDRPDHAALVQIAEVILDLRRTAPKVPVRRGPTHHHFIVG